jgi:hypothetical protein
MATVISASRRTDLARMFPSLFSRWLQQGWVEVKNPFSGLGRKVSLEPANVHTLVLWSKDYTRLLANEDRLLDRLRAYQQLYFHFTVTGLGGTPLEPGVVAAKQTDQQWEKLVAVAGDSRRVMWRFDPIVFWKDGRKVNSNLELFPEIARAAGHAGIKTVTTSLCHWYTKAKRRAVHCEIKPEEPAPEKIKESIHWLLGQCSKYNMEVQACSCPGLIPSGVKPAKCIDGVLLNQLHPAQLKAESGKDNGQRPDCGCSRSIDIGSYQLNCSEGCVYCYANPKSN